MAPDESIAALVLVKHITHMRKITRTRISDPIGSQDPHVEIFEMQDTLSKVTIRRTRPE